LINSREKKRSDATIKWKCDECGYEFDLPEIPEKCPNCGKEDGTFSLID
jgi:rubrerythrin